MRTTLTSLAGSLSHLLWPPGDQDAEGLTEEARQKRVERRTGLQKCVKFVEEAGVGGELLIDLKREHGASSLVTVLPFTDWLLLPGQHHR